MKQILILAILLMAFFSSEGISQTSEDISETTTYYLIRHAEKDRSDRADRNPHLNKLGQERAQKWSEVFKDVAFDAVYSTTYFRTRETAAPTATEKGLEIESYDAGKMYNAAFQDATKGKTVLVVGHSNTTPSFVNTILGEEKFPWMEDSDNGSLFIVTIVGETIDVQRLFID